MASAPAPAGAAPWQAPGEPTAALDGEIDRWAPPEPDAPIAQPAPWADPTTGNGFEPATSDGGSEPPPSWQPPQAAAPWGAAAFEAEPAPPSDHLPLQPPSTNDVTTAGAHDALDAIPDPFASPPPADAYTPVTPTDAFAPVTPADAFASPTPTDAFASPPPADAFASGQRDGADGHEIPMPDPFAIGESVDDAWGRPAAGDTGDSWSSSFAAGDETHAGEPRAAEDPWATPLSGSDADVWAGIVEAAAGDTAGGEPAFSTPWDSPGTAGDDPWALPAHDPWEPTPPAADVMPGVAGAPAPIDLDGLLQERARESVAQLGDHLTNAVDIERRAVVVVDGGDGAAVPVAVAMAAHLAAAGRRTLLVDPRGDVLATSAPGRYDVRDLPALEVLVGDATSDHLTLVADAAGEDTMVVFAGAAIDSPLVGADGDWAGAIVIATTGVANPASIPGDAFERVMGSRHPLIGIVSIMARPALAPPGN
jgi:hypothetical protein